MHVQPSDALPKLMLARYYSANLARFLSVDPSQRSFTAGEPQSWNRYAYVGNNPLGYLDPDGRLKFASTAAKQQYETAKQYLSGSKPARKLFKKLERIKTDRTKKHVGKRTREPTIELNSNHRTEFDPNSGTIHWDPNSGIDVASQGGHPDGGGGTVQSPALGLVHEVDHAVQRNTKGKQYLNDVSTPDPQFGDNEEEQRVVEGSEAKIAEDLDEPTRATSDADAFVRTGGPDKKQ